MEASLIEFSFQNLSAGLQIGLRSESILRSFFLLLEVEGSGRLRKAKLEIKIIKDGLLAFLRGFHNAILIEGEDKISFSLAMSRTTEQQLARASWLACVHGQYIFHIDLEYCCSKFLIILFFDMPDYYK